MPPVRPVSVMSNRTVGIGNWGGGAFIADIPPYGLAVEHRSATLLTFADKQCQAGQLNWSRVVGAAML